MYNIHSPFLYDFLNQVKNSTKKNLNWIEIKKIRQGLKNDHQIININDLGAGSRKSNSSKKKISHIAKTALSPQWQMEFNANTVKYLKAKRILELGTSLGVNSLYLSESDCVKEIITIEGSKEIAKVAQFNFDKIKSSKIKLVVNDFDSALRKFTSDDNPFDVIFVDGNHTYEATIRYFQFLKDYIHEKSVIIFDDIYWSVGMEKAWSEIISDQDVHFSIDFFYFGVVFFEKKSEQDQHLKYIPFKFKPWKIGLWG